MALLRREPPPRKAAARRGPDNPWGPDGPDVQTLSLAGDAAAVEQSAMLDIEEPFTKAMLDFEPNGRFTPTSATREMLLQMEPSDIYICQWPTAARPWEFYRNMLPDVPVTLCHACNHFYHEEDWELAVMSKGQCPFCRAPATEVDAGSAATFPVLRGGSGFAEARPIPSPIS